jgi:hypothetical protein
VLEVIYLIFNEGYATTAGDDWIRPELIEEALRLGCGQLTGQAVANTVVPRCAACGDRFLPHRPVAGVTACP